MQQRRVGGVLALFLLILPVLLGPAGLGGAAAFAMYEECGADCPCDDETTGAAEARSGSDTSASPADRLPDDGCPRDCGDCACCVHALHAVLGLPVAAAVTTRTSSAGLTSQSDPPHTGVLDGVFRPPRALA